MKKQPVSRNKLSKIFRKPRKVLLKSIFKIRENMAPWKQISKEKRMVFAQFWIWLCYINTLFLQLRNTKNKYNNNNMEKRGRQKIKSWLKKYLEIYMKHKRSLNLFSTENCWMARVKGHAISQPSFPPSSCLRWVFSHLSLEPAICTGAVFFLTHYSIIIFFALTPDWLHPPKKQKANITRTVSCWPHSA